jgi:NitT/TauT family transport system ATP-binding protein
VLGKELSLGIHERFTRRKEIREEVMYYLDQVKLAKDADKYPHELSGGMQQRVAIAQALIMKPKILLMDEPFGALDSNVREHLQIFLLEMWEKFKMTIFFVTHDLEEAVFVGTRILVLSQYYIDERGDGPNVRRGARIVMDQQLDPHAGSTAVKTSGRFSELTAEVRSRFDPIKRKWIEAYDLAHPDSFQTPAEESFPHRVNE